MSRFSMPTSVIPPGFRSLTTNWHTSSESRFFHCSHEVYKPSSSQFKLVVTLRPVLITAGRKFDIEPFPQDDTHPLVDNQ